MFTDSHTHIYSGEFGHQQKEAVRRAVDAGVTRLYMPNIDLESIDAMLDLARSFPENCFPMIGLHPTSVNKDYREQLETIGTLAHRQAFTAIGEVGIDLYWDKTFYKEQVDAFTVQIGWARELRLPLVIHSRESFSEIFRILDKEHKGELRGVFHSFTGNAEEAEKALSYGFYLGINGIVTYKNSKLPEVLAGISPERILLETDAPYLTPVPHRGKRNESAYLIHIAEKLAAVYGLPLEEIARISTDNATRLFKAG